MKIDTTKILKWITFGILLLYLILGLSVFLNNASTKNIMDDMYHMLECTQTADGSHSYVKNGDIHRINNGYTPLSVEICALGINLIGNDVRVVRTISAIFGLSAVFMVGLITWKLTNSKWMASCAAMLSSVIEPAWFMHVGPNTPLVFFTLLGLYFLIKSEKLSWTSIILSTISLFLAYWSKQTGMLFLAAGLFYIFIKYPKRGIIVGAVTFVVFLLSIWWYQSLPNSQFIYLAFFAFSENPIIWSRLTSQLIPLFVGKFGILMALSTYFISKTKHITNIFTNPLIIFLFTSFSGWFFACKYGSGLNQTWIFMCMLIICGFTALSKIKPLISDGLIYSLILIQTIALLPDYGPIRISKEDEIRYNTIMKILNTPNKKTYYINSGYLNYTLGQETFGQHGYNQFGKNIGREEELYPKEWRDFLNSNPWDIVIIDIPLEDGAGMIYNMLNRSYHPVAEIPPANENPTIGRLRFKKIVFEKNK